MTVILNAAPPPVLRKPVKAPVLRKPGALRPAPTTSDSQLSETAALFEAFGRPYRLSFGNLPKQRRFAERSRERQRAADELGVAHDALSLAKYLLPRHRSIRQNSSAKNDVEEAFRSRTLPYPVPGVRLFVFDPAPLRDLRDRNASADEFDQELARQRTLFEAAVHEKVQLYRKSVEALAADWPAVLEAARERLRDQFSLEDYPRADELLTRLYVRFWQEGNLQVAAPETRYLSAEMQRQERQAAQQRFEEIVQLQEQYAVQAFQEAVQNLVESLQAVDSGQQRFFQTSRVEKVFEQFREFQTKCVRYGILRGTAFEQELQRLRGVLNFDAGDAKQTQKALSDSQARRQAAISDLQAATETVGRLFEAGTRRRALSVD